jgi:hypothetical protein
LWCPFRRQGEGLPRRVAGTADRPAPHPGAAHRVLPRRHPNQLGQRVQVGLRYASQIVTIEVDETTLRVYDHLINTVPRTRRKEVTRHKAYRHTTNKKTG